jgi:hypothetical protein
MPMRLHADDVYVVAARTKSWDLDTLGIFREESRARGFVNRTPMPQRDRLELYRWARNEHTDDPYWCRSGRGLRVISQVAGKDVYVIFARAIPFPSRLEMLAIFNEIELAQAFVDQAPMPQRDCLEIHRWKLDQHTDDRYWTGTEEERE